MSRSDYDDMPTSFRKTRRRSGGRKSYIFALMGVLVILIVVIVLMVFNGDGDEEAERKQETSINVEVTEVEEVEVDVPEIPASPIVTETVEEEPATGQETAAPVTEPEEIAEEPAAENTDTTDTAATEEEETADEPESLFSEYTVVEGDSLSSIAQHFLLAPGTLASVNMIQDQTGIRAGDTLIIPPTDGKLYQVRANDTVDSIMKRFGLTDISKEEFLSLNMTDESLRGRDHLFIPQRAEENESPFIRPTDGELDKVFGETWKDEVLQGVTFSLDPGEAVVAIADGTVIDAGTDRNYGRFITVMHDDFYKSTYYCLEMTNVKLGQEVKQGDVIATVGTSCRYFGSSKLYFKLEQGPVKLDPMLFF